MDEVWENRVLRCHDPLFIPHFMHAPSPSPLFPIEEENEEDDRIENNPEVHNDKEDGENNGTGEALALNVDVHKMSWAGHIRKDSFLYLAKFGRLLGLTLE